MLQCEWTLEKEICRIADCCDFSAALRKLALLPSDTEKFSVVEDSKWICGGAETYLLKFRIIPDIGPAVAFIIKASVTFSLVSSINSILDEWIRRRYLLSGAGVSVPKLFGYRDGVLIEEFIHYHIRELLWNQNQNFDFLLLKLAKLAGILARLGFSPVNPFADLRSRGNDIVVIDFGEDLGPSRVVPPGRDEVFSMLIKTLEQWGIQTDQSTFDNMYCIFTQ